MEMGDATPSHTPNAVPKTRGVHHRELSVATHETEEGDYIRQVAYDDRNHCSVLFQMHGSVWPRVLPYCIVNVILTWGVFFAKSHGIDLTVNQSGHKFMAMLISFLVVARAKITYDRFMEARKYLSQAYQSCRELVQHVCVLSMDDLGDGAKKWRQNVAYRTILLLRVTMAAIEFKSTKKSPWEVPEVSSDEQDDLADTLMIDTDKSELCPERKRVTKWAHGARTLDDESFRAPICLEFSLRKEIMLQRKGGFLQKPFKHVNLELKMLDYVTAFNKAFHGLNKLMTTPFPFPLVQMARTFLFFWVFTLPFALCNVFTDDPSEPMAIILIVTYGFVGLEYVSMELDDPFGDDPNDFDDLGMAQVVFEDIYVAIYRTDGYASALALRNRIKGRMRRGSALANYYDDYGDEYKSPVHSVNESENKFD